ncbi:MerR family transcriptional regulator [Rhodococcus sp. USK13]|uniref:MerR family transcriptional regulator n=1 Tax=Rhodococcus sp. USK13 TaxID=2806442 RepID=UPI001BCFF20D|nr:MerR family transcriptional regulator [Rhodococcus sp. USK13]
MRSNELAKLAGVTVRTLRHYHQIGLLEEPERAGNGYRDYTVKHLATVLRIVSFTSLGIALSEVQRALDDATAGTELLDRIDQQAADEIERLTARRRIIAELKSNGAAPDLPAALIPYVGFLGSRGNNTPENERYEREQIALVKHFSEDAGMPWLVTAFENLTDSCARYVELMDQFESLPPDVPAEQRQPLVDEMVALLRSAVPLEDIPALGTEATILLLEHQDSHYNASQKLVWAQVLRNLVGLDVEAAQGF